jgi:hypothetical protein
MLLDMKLISFACVPVNGREVFMRGKSKKKVEGMMMKYC